MVGNAAGAIMAIYLLIIGLRKRDLVGTAAIFFLIVNLIKVPFYVHLEIINFETFKFNLMTFPAIFVGAMTGIIILERIPTKLFGILIIVFASFGAICLLLV